MKDRQPTQVLPNGAIRYGIYNADGTLDHYEYLKREDEPTVEGTPLNKANLLSDATAAKLWPNASARPEDPTVNDALMQLKLSNAKIGDILMTARSSLSDKWLECNGQLVSQERYPQLCSVLRSAATPALWTTSAVSDQTGAGDDLVSYANGYWFRSYKVGTARRLMVSSDLTSWTEWDISAFATADTIGRVHYYENSYVIATSTSKMYLAAEVLGAWTERTINVPSNDHVCYDGDIYYDGAYYIIPSWRAGVCYTDNLWTGTWLFRAGTWYRNRYKQSQGHAWDPVNHILYIVQAESDNEAGTSGYAETILEIVKNVGINDISAKPMLPSTTGTNLGATVSAILWVDGNLIVRYYPAGGTSSNIKMGIYNPTADSVQDIDTPSALKVNYNFIGAVYAGGNYIFLVEDDSKLYITASLITPVWLTVDLQYPAGTRYTSGSSSDKDGAIHIANNADNKFCVALSSTNITPRIVVHDFNYDNKYLPSITPSTDTKAYIKALEE